MLISPAQAEHAVMANLVPLPSEDCPLSQATGRVLRRPLLADRDLPPFDRVTLDGYALRSAEVAQGRRQFRIEGTPQAAGMMARALDAEPGSCIEIMTGAVLPDGADCIVPYEEVSRDGPMVTLSDAGASGLKSGHAVHRRGSDHREGAVVVPAGLRLRGAEIGTAAACGHSTVTVSIQPRIGLVSTGDELVPVTARVAPHQIRRSNDQALRAALDASGYRSVDCLHVRDIPEEIERELRRLVAAYDAVVITGGVSKGKFDHLPAILEKLSVQRHFHGVSQRPGKPLWFGTSGRHNPVFALPGNPVSCFVCLHRYVIPALHQMSGLRPSAELFATASERVDASPTLTLFLPVKVRGNLQFTPRRFNTSGDFTSLVDTDGFVEVPPGSSGDPSTPFRFYPWAG